MTARTHVSSLSWKITLSCISLFSIKSVLILIRAFKSYRVGGFSVTNLPYLRWPNGKKSRMDRRGRRPRKITKSWYLSLREQSSNCSHRSTMSTWNGIDGTLHDPCLLSFRLTSSCIKKVCNQIHDRPKLLRLQFERCSLSEWSHDLVILRGLLAHPTFSCVISSCRKKPHSLEELKATIRNKTASINLLGLDNFGAKHK